MKRLRLLVALLLLAAPAAVPAQRSALQQGVHYTLEAVLDTTAHQLQTYMTFSYLNNAPDTIRSLYFQLPANAYHNEQNTAYRELQRFSAGGVRISQRARNALTIHSVQFLSIGTRTSFPIQAYDFSDTILELALPAPLLPGDSLQIGMSFSQAARETYELWYPKIAVYDSLWHVEPFHFLMQADDVFSEFATVDARFEVPGNFIVVAPGEVVSGDPGWNAVRGDTAIADTLRKAWEDSVRASLVAAGRAGGPRKVRFVAGHVHEFVWSASPQFIYYPHDAGLPVHVFDTSNWSGSWGKWVLANIDSALAFVQRRFGPLPAADLRIVCAGEVEAAVPDLIAFDHTDDFALLAALAKTYMPGALATNGFAQGWMPRGLAIFMAKAYAEKKYGKRGYDESEARDDQDWFERHYPLPTLDGAFRNVAQLYLSTGQDEGIENTINNYRDPLSALVNLYLKSEIFFEMLQYVVGPAKFDAALQGLFAAKKFRRVTVRDVQLACERAAGQPLRWFFDEWLRGTPVVDYQKKAVRQFRRNDTTWVTEVELARKGSGIMPVEVELQMRNGESISQRWDGRELQGTVVFETREKPGAVRVDPDDRILDRNPLNNTHRRWEFHPDLPYLRYIHMPADAYVVFWRPTLGYNDIDGLKLGARARGGYRAFFHNLDLDLSFGLKSASVDGRIAYSHPLRRSRMFNRYSLMARKLDGRYELDAHIALQGSSGILTAAGQSLEFGANYTGVSDSGYTGRWLNGDAGNVYFAEWQDRAVATIYVQGRLQRGGRRLRAIAFGRGEAARAQGGRTFQLLRGRMRLISTAAGLALAAQVNAGALFGAAGAPVQYQLRAEGASAADRFRENVLPTGSKSALWSRRYVEGGAALRGYAGQPRLVDRYGSINFEIGPPGRVLVSKIFAFYDAGRIRSIAGTKAETLADAGIGLRLLDEGSNLFGGNMTLLRSISLRLYFPLWLSDPLPGQNRTRFRWYFSLGKVL